MRKLLIFIFITLFSSFGFGYGKSQTHSLKVTYVANEGFLIESQTKKVLIDVIFNTGFGQYLVATKDIQKKLHKALPLFNDVDLVLVTHKHADHFEQVSVGRHLINNSNVYLFCPLEVQKQIEMLENYREIEDQITSVTPEWQSTVTRIIKVRPIFCFVWLLKLPRKFKINALVS